MTAHAFTPTTEQVRDGYRYDSVAEHHDPVTPHHIYGGQAFDRWLAGHDREVAAAALARVKALHTSDYTYCLQCHDELMPCPTLRALEDD